MNTLLIEPCPATAHVVGQPVVGGFGLAGHIFCRRGTKAVGGERLGGGLRAAAKVERKRAASLDLSVAVLAAGFKFEAEGGDGGHGGGGDAEDLGAQPDERGHDCQEADEQGDFNRRDQSIDHFFSFFQYDWYIQSLKGNLAYYRINVKWMREDRHKKSPRGGVWFSLDWTCRRLW